MNDFKYPKGYVPDPDATDRDALVFMVSEYQAMVAELRTIIELSPYRDATASLKHRIRGILDKVEGIG